MDILCFDAIETIIGLNPVVYSQLCSIKYFRDMFLLENKPKEYWKKKFGYVCYIHSPSQDVDNKRSVEWKYRAAILGPKYIPCAEIVPFGVYFGRIYKNGKLSIEKTTYQIIGRAIIRKWRKDIEGVPYKQILHCSGAAAELYQKHHIFSELVHDVEYDLSVNVEGVVTVKDINILIYSTQWAKRWNIASNKISFMRTLPSISQISTKECVVSVTCFPIDVELWRFVIGDRVVVINGTWRGFSDLVKERYPEIHPDVMKFYHDLTFLLIEQPRLSSFSTMYDDYFRSRVSIPKVEFWRDDFSCPP